MKKSKINTKAKLGSKEKARWVAALRSGKYEQTSSCLCNITDNGNSYCCLGVACNLAGIPDKEISNYAMPFDLLANNKKEFNKLSNFFRQNSESKDTQEKNILTKLAGFNDEGKSFKWIASYIERYL